MDKKSSYFYKGFDITSNNRLERIMYEYQNPYGYNLESNSKRAVNYEQKASHTTQDLVKCKGYLGYKH